jgi:trk system potassium uptake protein TrkH
MVRYVGSLAAYSARTVTLGYFFLIIAGGSLLALPISWGNPSQPISFIDGVFTATSATCVTGLSVRSTGNDFSLFGQWVILVLIQIGGIGIMTITTLATLTFGTQESLRARTVLADTLGLGGLSAADILKRILGVTFAVEFIGAALLAARFLSEMPLSQAVYFGVFHSVSAFNNAGFGLLDNNLCNYVTDFPVSLTISFLIILGGIGYPTYDDIRRNLTSKHRFDWLYLRLQTKVVILSTSILLVGGTVFILALEWSNTLEPYSPAEKVLAAFFQSVTTRTAGFNTLRIEQLTTATLFLMILLMAVGAAPCSTGGGMKVSTVATLVCNAWSRIRGYAEVTVLRRTIATDLVSKATTFTLLYLVVCTVGMTLLLLVETNNVEHGKTRFDFMDYTFEAFSALGTVGLSTGVTPNLSSLGKIVIILLMYVGRIGPITLAVVISREVRHRRVEYAKESLLIG